MSSAGTSSLERGATPVVPPGSGAIVSLSQALNGNNNSLGLIRLVLAAAVIFDHAFPLGGFGLDPVKELTRDQASLGSLAVGGFFAISGYLIAKSGMSGDVVQFMWRRTLRIFPAYWAVLLVTGFVIAPLIWWLGYGRELAGYFTPGGGVTYFVANFTLNIGAYGIHDLLATTTPYGEIAGQSVFNGSIWTLIYEWTCYLIIAVMVLFGILRNARILVPILTAFYLVLQILAIIDLEWVGLVVPQLADPFAISLTFTFLLGSTLAVYSRTVPFDDRLGILSAIVLLVSLRYGGFLVVGTIAGAYLVMYLAARLPARVQWIGKKNDYSYGVYIYGFLVQQVLAYLGAYRLGYVPFVALSLLITFGFAWLSWHGVEKWAMRLKSWGPGKGVRHWFDKARQYSKARRRPAGEAGQ
ncbi:peptidoglycan/LPS O-acetylase OafA/YrhL [Microbacteriaceae bacterium SG_E_30_P1]|uniref:Peptidoglycan/LPS O-acetylase OafA/YrhL n=1 Tax=Antiquaquibacter oligotrophicus TaxID=2880260 RepID=A0ABT6KPI0_9MICO|nr:acyltransferase [Antiquaquibacter oligotrophicus]MDH6181706.1 peptidoglycan/LPS O-acetylase OafA/YrhL [Antiquaquibacter oligotrophicus]UDF12611.1 acyltransferase [Antiquaquibacter oligotrophicus]